VKLGDYAHSGKYLKWKDTNIHHISLQSTYDEFYEIEPVLSDSHGSEQYEVPIRVHDPDIETYESILATKSKLLLVELINHWKVDENLILRIHKEGTGFYTKWKVAPSNHIYDKVSGKVKKRPAKKK